MPEEAAAQPVTSEQATQEVLIEGKQAQNNTPGEGVVTQPDEVTKEKATRAEIADKIRKDRELYLLKSKARQYEKEISELKSFREEFKKDPYSVLESHGHSYDDWLRKQLGKQKTPEELAKEAVEETRKIRSELSDRDKRAQEEHVRHELDKFKDQVKKYVENQDTPSVAGTRRLKADSLVVNTISQLVESGEGIDMAKAASMVEESIKGNFVDLLDLEEYQEYAVEKLKKLGKLGSKQSSPVGQEVSKRPSELTNNLAAQAPTRNGHALSANERRRRAAALFKQAISGGTGD